jgi:hypothetical protein
MRRLWLVIVFAVGLLAVAASIAGAHPEPGDVDGDGVRDEFDNCAQTRNADQLDTDGDGLGDRCDADADADGVPNSLPYLDPREPGQDNCPQKPNPGQEPSADPRFGAACYVDSDGDGAPDPLDNCPASANPGQADYDFDRTGDACDPDDDEDGEFDAVDNCPFTYNYDQGDADGDGIGTACDQSETVGGGSGGSGGSGGGEEGSSDRSPPTLRLRLARTQRLAELGAGMAVEVRCSEGCALQARLTINRAAARRLRIGRRETIVARGSAALAERGTTYVFVRFNRGMTRRLGRQMVRAQLSLTAADQAGNERTSARSLRLRR